MEITIDDAISNIEMIQTQLEITNQPRSITFDIAIDTMRKYKEIRKIYMTHHYTDEEVIEKIKEVIKYG